MEKPKIVAVKHKKLSLERKPTLESAAQPLTAINNPQVRQDATRPNFLSQPPALTELEKSLAEVIRGRGEKLPVEFERKLEEGERREKALKQRQEMDAKIEAERKEREARKKEEERKAQEQAAQEAAAKEQAASATAPEKKGEATEEASQATAGEPSSENVQSPQTPAEQTPQETAQPEQVIVTKPDEPKPRIVQRKEYTPLTTRPAVGSMQKVREDIVREVREQASRDILPVRKEIGKPLATVVKEDDSDAEQIVREIEEQVDPGTQKQRIVDEAIKKFEKKEGEKSLVKRLMRSLGLK